MPLPRVASPILALVVSVAALAGLVAIPPDPVHSTMELVRRFDSLADQLPKEELLTSLGDMELWALEVLPYMEYEGLALQTVWPADLTLFYEDGSKAFHVAGRAACRDVTALFGRGPVWMNFRYTNPHATWYGAGTSLGTLVHELIHIQGGPFCTGESEDLESNTQIAMVEVLSAMVNHGNKPALRTLLLELRSIGLSALQYELSREEYVAFLDSISDDPFEMARADKSYRYWMTQGGEQALREILFKYNLTPWNAIVEGAADGTVERVQLPTWGRGPHSSFAPMLADDMAYFFAHAEELVAQAMR